MLPQTARPRKARARNRNGAPSVKRFTRPPVVDAIERQALALTAIADEIGHLKPRARYDIVRDALDGTIEGIDHIVGDLWTHALVEMEEAQRRMHPRKSARRASKRD